MRLSFAMFSLSSCPHCGQQVLISADLSAECLVRCPICEAEFPLGQALANAVDAPPELVPVARDDKETARREAEEQPIGWGLSPSGPVQCKDAESVSEPTSRDAGAAPQPTSVAGSAAADHAPSDAQPNAVPAVSHSEAAALWRSRQKPDSSLGSAGKAVAIAIGGFLGIAVAYLALSLVSPSRFDFLRLWGQPKQGNTSGPASGFKKGGSAGQTPGKFDPDNPSFEKR
jgi:hypothetical protein